jgi:peptide/nickel transport system permease protein
MGAYLARRLLALLPTLVLASLIVFVTIRLIPGDVIDLMLSQNDVAADKLSRDQLVAALGLDRPMWQQYLRWVGGHRAARRPGAQSLWQTTPVTELLFAAGCPSPSSSAAWRWWWRCASRCPSAPIRPCGRTPRATTSAARSPSCCWPCPASGWPPWWWCSRRSGGAGRPRSTTCPSATTRWQNLKQMALPAVVLGAGLSAITMRLMRTMMLEVLRQDYIRTAWAKGLPERLVVVRHALRNAMVPVVTLVGLQAPLLIGGAVIIEQIFVIPGMGLLLLDAVQQRDYPIITGVFLVVGVAVMLINLLVDLSYGLLDPKVRYR